MEAATVVSAGRGGSQSTRKEWRSVPEHSVRNISNEDLERSKLGQSDERTIYEVQQGSGSLNVDFCSITMDESLDNDPLRHQLHSVSRQREEFQQMEIDLRAQAIARSEIMELQSSFDAQIKEHANIASKLKEKLLEREQTIRELELRMEDKDRELRATKIDKEVVWAKEDLLREQKQELAAFRRERDNSEAERTQHHKQMHELKEHIQEKERQFLELEEQHRVAQETIVYKDEQLREAQAWVARVQEMDHSVHSELRKRTEHFNQFCLQFADMERHHLQAIQQLQLELAEARERSGTYTDESRVTQTDSKGVPTYGHINGNQYNVNEGGNLSANSEVLPNGNVDGVLPFVSTGNALTEAEHAPGVPVVPSSLLGMGAYLSPGQMTALHPFVMHQQGVPHSIPSAANSHVPQPHVGHFQPIPAISFHQHWQNQQVVSEGLQISNQSQYLPSGTEQNLLTSGAHYDYEVTENGQVLRSDYLESRISPSQEPGPAITASSVEAQILEANNKTYLITQQLDPNLQESSSKFHDALGLGPDQNSETKGDENTITVTNSLQEKGLTVEPPSLSETPIHQVKSRGTIDSNATGVFLIDSSISTIQRSNSMMLGKIPEPTLLDERSLLACIVRAIPAGSGGRIRISSTLPNRLGKMLAPLHWHDYKKKFGKLDDFLSGHPELFFIEGDFIQLREGAQEIISASAAMAKVAAAAAAPTTYSSLLPSVAVTPMAQNHRLKKIPSINSKAVKNGATETEGVNLADSAMQSQQSNGVCYNFVQGLSNVKILSKPKDPLELNGLQSEIRSGHSSVHMAVGNGTNPDRTNLATSQNKGLSNGRHGVNFGGKQQGRAAGAALTSRR